MQSDSKLLSGDCLEVLSGIESNSVDLAYLDPPFFTNRTHVAVVRDRSASFEFSDSWTSAEEYRSFMLLRLQEVRRVLRDTGSIYVHCDKNANFLIRTLLEGIFGTINFRAEIVWTYRRWSNSAKGLLPAHQTIYYYTKSKNFTFNPVFLPYSSTTNIDQILQKRARDEHGVSVYARAEDGTVLFGSEKNGVPLSDVWDIPFLNPKARERTGYPTQKPLLLLERIIRLSTNEEDVVLDPFCGSGTTLVAASLLRRRYIGIDSSSEALALARSRLESPIKSNSAVLTNGRASYQTVNQDALTLLKGLDIVPVQRNAGIDAFFKTEKTLVPVRVQRHDETLSDAANKLYASSVSRLSPLAVLVKTHEEHSLLPTPFPSSIIVVESTALSVQRALDDAIKHLVEATIRKV